MYLAAVSFASLQKSSGEKGLSVGSYPMTWFSASISARRSATRQRKNWGQRKREQMCRNSAGSKRRK